MSFFSRFTNKLSVIKYDKYRKKLNAMNKNLAIYGQLIIKDYHKIEIGRNCRLNDFAFLHGGGGLVIEDDVTVSAFAKIISYGYDTRDWVDNYLIKEHVGGLIHIGKGSWIGAGTTILPGVKLTGKGIIVAAGSVVTKSFNEDFVVVGGNPATILKRYSKS
ncbi:acyltransferase [Peribacillus frigoritolerans]|uniref:acyltransferase n=1 Tax=Peribacillus frigoritolerans TaxID=450367 RepID=UPI0038725E27